VIVAEAAQACKPFVSIHPSDVDYSKPWAYARDYQSIELYNFKALARLIMGAVWSDCVWKEGHRREENFISSHLCVLDVDNGYPLEQAVKELCDTQHIIASTKSHGIKGDRFRIVLPWTTPITDLDIYRHNVERRIERFECDASCVDAARFFWPCKELVSYSAEGFTEDVKPLPINYRTKSDRQIETAEKHLQNPGTYPAWLREALRVGAKEGYRNNTIYEVAKVLFYHGKSEDETFHIIRHSKIPLATAPDKEILHAIRSGRKKGRQIVQQKEERERQGSDDGPLPGDCGSDEQGMV
jgi:hypothetical protein